MSRLRRETQRRIDLAEAVIDAAQGAQRGGKLNLEKRIKLEITRCSYVGDALVEEVNPFIWIGSSRSQAATDTEASGIIRVQRMFLGENDQFLSVALRDIQVAQAQRDEAGGKYQRDTQHGGLIPNMRLFDRPLGRLQRGVDETSRQQAD